MNLHLVKTLALLIILCATPLSTTSKKTKVLSRTNDSQSEDALVIELPVIIIKTIRNTTPYDILLVDRLAKDTSIILPAGKAIEVNFKADIQNKVIINGSMADFMGEYAQYVFKKLDHSGKPELDQEVYFNLYMNLGGVDNGNHCTIGTSESLIINFYVAGKNGGCLMTSQRTDRDCQTGEFELKLSIDGKDVRSNIFRLDISGHLTTYQ